MRKIAKDKVQIQLYSILLLLMMFVEEDMNILTNSSVLPILTDKFHIARLKIGYLISAIAVPICSIVPLSTWSAVISLFLENSGIGPESTKMLFIGYPFITYLKSIPFSFHSILMIISAIIVVLSKSSFGIIGEHETIAEKKGDLFGGEKPAYLENTDLCKEIDSKEYSFMDFLMPIFCLPVSILCWILYFGDCTVFGGTNGFLDCLENSKIETSLLLGGLTSLFVAFCMSTYKRKVSALDSSKSTLRGMWMMKDSLLTLSLAWTLANFLRTELQTGEFLSLKLMPFISVSFIPIFSFLLAATLSFCIGSSWGSMAIVFPIAIPMLAKMLAVATPISINSFPILYPVIGAIISGALLGSSISPISYLLIMNAKNLEIDHFQLLKSQFQYVLPTALSSLVAF
jgi:Na+/H+ antiporter NhaC